jgi:formiminoglutamase
VLNKFPHLKPAGTAKFVDSKVVKITDLIKSWDGEEVEGFGMIGLPLSKPSISHSGAAFAPEHIRKALSSCSTYAVDEDIDLQLDLTNLGDVEMHVTDIVESNKRIEQLLLELLKENEKMIPIILGGDHSISAPSIKAFSKAKGNIAVIQFDAHHDLRNLEDGGPSNGTPFRQLLEGGHLQGDHLLQIGIRNFANSQTYYHYALENGVKVVTMKEVKANNMKKVIHSWLEKRKENIDAIYVSVDMDVLDQAFAPGCPAIGPGGMDSSTLLDLAKYLGTLDKVKAIDIVEIDPTVDIREMTSKVAAHVILAFLLGKTIKQKDTSI